MQTVRLVAKARWRLLGDNRFDRHGLRRHSQGPIETRT